MIKEKRILFLVHSYYEFDTRVRRHCEHLSNSGFSVSVLCLSESGKEKSYNLNGVRVHESKITRSKEKTIKNYIKEYLGFIWCCFKYVNREVKAGNIGCIIVNNMPNALVFSCIKAKIFRVPIVLDVHDLMSELSGVIFKGKSLLKNCLVIEERLSFGFSDHITTVSEPVKNLLSKKTRKNIHVYHNSPYLKLSSPPTLDADEDKRIIDIVYHGNMHERYGLQRIFRPLDILSKTHDVRLSVFGKGPYEQEIKELADERSYASFEGEFKPQDVPTLLEGKDIGLILNYPNRSNDFALPVKLLEYVSSGVPVLCPKLPIIIEYFGLDSFYYFEDDSDIIPVLESTIKDPVGRKIKSELAKKHLEMISWEKEKHQYTRFIGELIES